MNTQIILCMVIYATKAHQEGGNEPRCSEKSVAYWSEKYTNKYTGDDEPEIRCDKENGYCMWEGDTCVSNDWVRWQTSCYDKCYCCFYKAREESSKYDWYLHEERKTWQEAKEYCQINGGSLLVPENIADVIEFMRKKDTGTHDVWVGIKDFFGKYKGIDGNYIHNGWQVGQPRAIEKQGENCVALEYDRGDKPGMKVEPCYAENYFICNYMKEYRKGHDVFIDDSYNMNEIDVERYAFRKYSGVYGKTIVIEDFRRTWQEARDRCKERGGDLLVPPLINDLVDYIRDRKLGSHDIWVGYRNPGNTTMFEGTHGNNILEGWQEGEPRVHTPGQDCVVVEDDDAKGAGFKVQPCQKQHLYACDLSKDYLENHDTQH